MLVTSKRSQHLNKLPQGCQITINFRAKILQKRPKKVNTHKKATLVVYFLKQNKDVFRVLNDN